MKIKYLKDYYDLVIEAFPNVPESDIKKILNFGWKSLYLHNSYGGDVVLSDKEHGRWYYFGRLTKNSLKHYKYYIKKLSIKLRVLGRRRRIPYDGYYYFGLNDNDYEECYGKYLKKKGRKRKYFTFHNIVMYTMLDECKLRGYGHTHIFRVPIMEFIGFTRYRETFTTDKAELILVRECPKFKDILVTNYNYELL